MRWHWLYGDFVRAFRASRGEHDWVGAYTRLYLEPHLDTLTQLHFVPKGYADIEAALARLRQLGRQRYRTMVEALERRPDVAELLPSTVTGLMAMLHAPLPEIPIHVIVGLDCTNIYSVARNGETATVLCLEAVDANRDGLRLLLAHEAHHWAREAVWGPHILTATVGERLATEGLAIAFSRRACPGLAAWEYCFVPEATYRWVQAHQAEWYALVEPRLSDDTLMDALFARAPHTLPLPGMPARTGYVYGCLAAEAARRGRRGHFGVSLPWRDVLTICQH